jgi:hypothetical protein
LSQVFYWINPLRNLDESQLTERRFRTAIRAILGIRLINLIASLVHKGFLFGAFVLERRPATYAIPVFLYGNVLAPDTGLQLILLGHLVIPLKFVDTLLQVYSDSSSRCATSIPAVIITKGTRLVAGQMRK